jgi:hypothetical protein
VDDQRFGMFAVAAERDLLENSCRTPSILTAVIAAPSTDESRMRRSAFPIVVPNPRSNG